MSEFHTLSMFRCLCLHPLQNAIIKKREDKRVKKIKEMWERWRLVSVYDSLRLFSISTWFLFGVRRFTSTSASHVLVTAALVVVSLQWWTVLFPPRRSSHPHHQKRLRYRAAIARGGRLIRGSYKHTDTHSVSASSLHTASRGRQPAQQPVRFTLHDFAALYCTLLHFTPPTLTNSALLYSNNAPHPYTVIYLTLLHSALLH